MSLADTTSSFSALPARIRFGPEDDLAGSFYVPLLALARRCDRLSSGVFSPRSLVAAAAGLEGLIANGGSLRLLCWVAPEADEARPFDLAPSADPQTRRRLEALAWMLAHRHLEIRLARAPNAEDLGPPSLPEEGLAVDAEGRKLVWSGGPGALWTFASFDRGAGEERIARAPQYVRAFEHRFAALWESGEALPAELRSRLLSLCPDEAPRHGSLKKARPARAAPQSSGEAGLDERLILRFLREAPFLPETADLGIATSAVEPWPHQLRLVRRLVRAFPRSFLLADEVGLGKTIEAGLALRQLVLSGRVRRALLLVPRSVLRQWQEELYEKTALRVPRFENGKLYDVFDRQVRPVGKRAKGENPWNREPLLLASSQLARRRDRRAELLRADPWDLVIVDEAHHARRRDFRADTDRPNHLLALLGGSGARRGLKDRTRCLYLLTATPMQVHPVEIWDLLKLLGLGGRWGALKEHFLRFFEELRRPPRERDWPFLAEMLGDALSGGSFDTPFRRAAVDRLGEARVAEMERWPKAADPRAWALGLEAPARKLLEDALRRHTPLRTFIERNTRQLLYRYRMQGRLSANVPERRPENVWIPMNEKERELYEKIEAYLCDFYRRYERERRGLGFVMTVYRRRLTSSFYAIRKSLERRRAALVDEAASPAGLALEVAGDDEPERDLRAPGGGFFAQNARGEQAYLEDFLREIAALGRDSKVERLLRDLEHLLQERETALVFTQYTDTMDHLRDELLAVYGSRVACYSGRGGEVFDGSSWSPSPKEEIKRAFLEGEIRVLLASDSASEGLNLQTCGILINFDMPWNPMRVEQRIGRLDRIGQRFREVWIKSYFYADSVEATIYRRLSERIRWFEEVLGRLQPILHRVGEIIEETALLAGKKRQRRLEERLTRLEMEFDETAAPDLGLEHLELAPPEAPPEEISTPVSLADLESVLTGSEALGGSFSPHTAIRDAYRLRLGERERTITFRPEVFDRYPNSVELLTYGHPWLEEILGRAEAPEASPEPGGLGLYLTQNPEPLRLFFHPAENTDGRRGDAVFSIARLEDLKSAITKPAGRWTGNVERAATALFSEARKRRLHELRDTEKARHRALEGSLVEAARQILKRAALVTLASGRHPSLFEKALSYGFGPEAVEALRRRGEPFSTLLDLVAGEEIGVFSDDPYFLKIEGRSAEELGKKAKALLAEGKEVMARYRLLREGGLRPGEAGGVLSRIWFPLEGAPREDPRPKELSLRTLPASEVRPFQNAVPLYSDLETLVERFMDTPDGELPAFVSRGRRGARRRKKPRPETSLQADEIQNPADYTWVEPGGRTVPQAGLFVARHEGEAMNHRIRDGAWGLFRLLPPSPRNGRVVLAHHREADPETGARTTLRIYESEARTHEDGTWRQRVVLRPASTDASFQPVVLEDPEESGFRILAELLEVLG